MSIARRYDGIVEAANASKSVPGFAPGSFGSGYQAPSVVVMLLTASLVPGAP